MVGPTPSTSRDDHLRSIPSPIPSALPKSLSMKRVRGQSSANAVPYMTPAQQPLHRVTSNQANGTDAIANAESARRPSMSPDGPSRHPSQAPMHTPHPRPSASVSTSNHQPNSSSGQSTLAGTTIVARSTGPSIDLGPPSLSDRPVNGSNAARQPSQATARTQPNGTRTARKPSTAPVGGLQSVGEFAQQHLFSQFKEQANAKIAEYTAPRYKDGEINIYKHFGPNADSNFDQLLLAIGHSAARNPTSFIDKVKVWHDTVIEQSTFPNQQQGSPGLRQDVFQERKTSLAIYLLCRALLEILRQTSSRPLARPELDRVEDLVYKHRFRALCRETPHRTSAGQAKWDILTQVIGGLFDADFDNMAKRVVRDLEEFQSVLGIKGTRNEEVEAEAISFLRGLRTVKLKADNEFQWSRSCGFLHQIASLFDGIHGQSAKEAYCRFIGAMLLPVAGLKRSEGTAWTKQVNSLSARLAQLDSKPKYWASAFPTQAILACVAPNEIFESRFRASISMLATKLKERSNRATAIKAICRLLWTYLERTRFDGTRDDVYIDNAHDTRNKVEATIKEVIRAVFFSGKRYSLSREPAIAEPLVQLIRVIGYRHQHICFHNIIFPLLNGESIGAIRDAKDVKLEQIDPDKSVIGIRASLAVFDDLEHSTRPPFPIRFEDERYQDQRITSSSAEVKPREGRYFKLTKLGTAVEPLITPIKTEAFTDSTRAYVQMFCELVHKIVFACDAGYGGQAAMHDRFATPTAPKTPLTSSFNRKDDAPNTHDDRNTFFELLNVGICALPRCMAYSSNLATMLTCLCNGTAHVQLDIASASMHVLKSIAKQGLAQQVIDRFLGFILNYDNRCSIGGTLGLSFTHIEHTLRLYVELLYLWVEDLHQKMARNSPDRQLTLKRSDTTNARDPIGKDTKPTPLDASAVVVQVDRVESQALFFLCSPSPKIRCHAKDILAVVTELDAALNQSHIRINTLLETQHFLSDNFELDGEQLDVYQKSILQRETKPLNKLICGSTELESAKDLWYTVLPHLIEPISHACPMAVAQTRDDVLTRLAQMQPIIEDLDDKLPGHQHNGSMDLTASRTGRHQPQVLSDTLIDQWKAYLIFACKTMTKTGGPVHEVHAESVHTRKSSKSSSSTQESINTSSDLFCRVLPFLLANSMALRHATVIGLGSIGVGLLRSLLESIELVFQTYETQRRIPNHNRAASSPRRHQNDGFSADIAHIFELVANFLKQDSIKENEWILKYFSTYAQDVSSYLQTEHGDSASTALKIHFCKIVDQLWVAVKDDEEKCNQYLSFWTRRGAFTNMERWTGLPGLGGHSTHSDASSPAGPHSRGSDPRHIRPMHPQEMKERETLKRAAMNSMATLCDGPLGHHPAGGKSDSFDYVRLMHWVHQMFLKNSDSVNDIGRRALRNIYVNNPREQMPRQKLITKLYDGTSMRCLNNYLSVASSVGISHLVRTLGTPTVLTALLFTLSNSDGTIRTMSARLLRELDEMPDSSKAVPSCKIQTFDMSISDRTPAVYKKAQFGISAKLAEAFASISDNVFAEFSRHFKRLGANAEEQRNFIHAILPWIKNLDLQWQQQSQEITPRAYMVLMNLLEITLNYSAPLQHEVQALWQTLVAGPYRGNVRLILDFTMDLTLEKRNPQLVEVARQIIVFLSDTQAGERLVDGLIQQIAPMKMEHEEGGGAIRSHPPDTAKRYAHIGDIPLEQTDPHNPWDMTAGQLSLILLVDLIVAPRKVPAKSIPRILQAVLVLWDHKIPIVQEQAREMLVHLIHELVISELDEKRTVPRSIINFVDLVRKRDKKVLWSYAENERADKGFELSDAFQYVVSELISTFAHIYPDIAVEWGRVTLHWALNCRVLHLALRSLQVYRCILLPLDEKTDSDLVRVVSYVIADEEPERQSFAIEAMRTIRAVLLEVQPKNMPMFTQLFWAVSTWLGIGREAEYAEGLVLLDIMLDKFDFNEPSTCKGLMDTKPQNLNWPLGGLTTLVLPGCRSKRQLDSSLRTLDRLIRIPSNSLVGDDERLLYVLLANMPRFLSLHTDRGHSDAHALAAAGTLANAASRMRFVDLALELEALSSRHGTYHTFAARIIKAISAAFFPTHEFHSLVFVMGMLTNSTDGMQHENLIVLDNLTNNINMTNDEISGAGPDLVSPLLRLLQTDLCQLALTVLDKFSAIMSNVTGGQQLHMSMATPRSSRAQRKQYDEIQSLYGIPEESGWSVAAPGKLKTSTRDNLYQISLWYIDASVDPTDGVPTPEVEFQKENASNVSYFPETSPPGVKGASLNETSTDGLVSHLDHMDDFFSDDDEDADTMADSVSLARSPAESTPVMTFPSPRTTPMSSFGSVSSADAPDLSTFHNRSFQSSISSSRAPLTPREPVMSPSAFKPATSSTVRPRMPNRSITSPAGPQRTTPESTFLTAQQESEPFSDDDVMFSGATSDASSMIEGPQRSMPRSRSLRAGVAGVTSGIRRLTGQSKPRTLKRGPSHTHESPEVPRLPNAYLQDPRSAEP